MTGYEFTERGKVIIIVLIIAILVIPASVIAFRVWSSSSSSDDNSHQVSQQTPDGSQHNEQEPVVTESPPPGDTGFDPVDPPGGGDNEHGSFDPPVEPPEEPDEPDDPDDPGDPDDTDTPGDPGGEEQPPEPDMPEIGPISIDRSAGTMHFMFAPELQESLDADTITMLGDFITSPRNTRDSKILIEIPVLPAAQTTALTLAIADAFSQYGISQRSLTFEAYQADLTNSSFEIIMYFIQTSSPK